jgi:hypothetical protein
MLQVLDQGTAKLASPSLFVLRAEVLREQAKTPRNWLRQAGFGVLEVLQDTLDPGKSAAVLLSGADDQLAVHLPGEIDVSFRVKSAKAADKLLPEINWPVLRTAGFG